jgi:hypothetical protein
LVALSTENGLRWDGDTLFDRLDDPTRDYSVHATADLLLVSSSRKTGPIAYTALCAFFPRPQAPTSRDDVHELVRAACRFWKTPVFVYAGTNTDCRNCRGLACPPGCDGQFSFNCAISAPRPTLCTSTASS